MLRRNWTEKARGGSNKRYSTVWLQNIKRNLIGVFADVFSRACLGEGSTLRILQQGS